MKVIFPVLWIGVFAIVTVLLFSGGGGFTDEAGNPPDPSLKWTVLFGIGAVGGVIIALIVARVAH